MLRVTTSIKGPLEHGQPTSFACPQCTDSISFYVYVSPRCGECDLRFIRIEQLMEMKLSARIGYYKDGEI